VKRGFLAWTAALIAGLVHAEPYPAKPVRFLIPFPPGGPTDIVGRLAAERLSRSWALYVAHRTTADFARRDDDPSPFYDRARKLGLYHG